MWRDESNQDVFFSEKKNETSSLDESWWEKINIQTT